MERGLIAMLQAAAGTALDSVRHVVCTMRAPGALAGDLPPSTEFESLGIRGPDRLAFIKLAGVITRHRPQLLHARNSNTWCDCVLAARWSRRPRPLPVLGFHGLESPNGFSTRQRRWARRLRLDRRRFTTVSIAGADLIRRQLHTSPHNITLLANGVDTTQFTPVDPARRPEFRERFGLSDREIAAVMVGSLVEAKDHANAIEGVKLAARDVGYLHLLIVGGGPLRAQIERSARDIPANVRVTLLGARRTVVDALHAADLFLLSSRTEQASHAMLEAMACALPVVVTDVGDSARVVEHDRCGLVVPPEDPAALAKALVRVAKNPDMRDRLGSAARRRVLRDLDMRTMADRYGRYYQSLIPNSQGAFRPCAVSLV